jgi:hypothetical protein
MGIAFDFPLFRVKLFVGVWNPVCVNSPRYTRSFPFLSSAATNSGVTVIFPKAGISKKIPANGVVGISFKRVAKNYLISLNGRLAVKFNPGLPREMPLHFYFTGDSPKRQSLL